MFYLFRPLPDAIADKTDQSLWYLGAIFGDVGGVLPVPAGDGVQVETLLGSMFGVFNNVVLVIGVLMILYVTVVGLMNTAHEGTFMGKNWNNLWIPIRACLGIAMLIPMPTGYSVIQIVMMWAIAQGIAAADMVWNSALDFIGKAGSPFAQIALPSTSAEANIGLLFNGLVCQHTASMNYSDIFSEEKRKNAYFCNTNSGDAFCNLTGFLSATALLGTIGWSSNGLLLTAAASKKNPALTLGPGGSCGTLKFANAQEICRKKGADSLACRVATVQFPALFAVVNLLDGYAKQIADLDYSYQRYFQDASGGGGVTATTLNGATAAALYCAAHDIPPDECDYKNLPKPLNDGMNASNYVIDYVYWPFLERIAGWKSGEEGIINVAVKAYTDTVQSVVDNFINNDCANGSKSADCPEVDNFFSEQKAKGWIFAGSYYLQLAKSNSENLKSSTPRMEFNIDPKIAPTSDESLLNNRRNNFNAAEEFVYLANGGEPSAGSNTLANKADQTVASGQNDMNQQLNQQLNRGSRSSGVGMPESVRNPVDPISQLTGTGYALMLIAGILYAVLLVIFTIIAILVSINITILGSGLTSNIASNAFWYLMVMFVPIIFTLLGVMISVGATFGVYIPFIPFTIFTVGAIGWMISTLEAMVAGPLVALGIISPSGHHEILGKAEPGLMLLLGICLRPVLMIFGMMGAMLLSVQVMNLLDAGFATVTNTMYAGGISALRGNAVASIMVLIVYCGLVVTVLNKTFSAIYIIPERVMTWIGGQAVSHGEGEASSKLEGSVSSGSGQMGQGLSSAQGSVGAGPSAAATNRGDGQGKKGKLTNDTLAANQKENKDKT